MLLKALAFNGITIIVTFVVAFIVAGLIKFIAVIVQRRSATEKPKTMPEKAVTGKSEPSKGGVQG